MTAVIDPADTCPSPRPGRWGAEGTAAHRGATMAEYALLLAAIAVVVLGAALLFGDTVLGLFRRAVDVLP
jgi:Flp pilus assembly pilin Flp